MTQGPPDRPTADWPGSPPAVAALAMPTVMTFADNLLGVLFPVMKILPALRLVEAAPAGKRLIETSSGTMALALAMVCAAFGRHLTVVTPPLEAELERHLRALGSFQIVSVPGGDPVGGNQAARLRVLHELLQHNPDMFWMRQYENPLVAEAYAPVGDRLGDLRVDCLVAAVGSGGSAVGIGRALRRHRPHARLVAVDALRSVLFGRQDGPRLFPGMGNSIIPRSFNHSAFDEVHWLSDPLIGQATRELTRETGILLGPSGGSALLVARWLAAVCPEIRVACVIPEFGHRYLNGLYGRHELGAELHPALVDQRPSYQPSDDVSALHWQAEKLKRSSG